MKIETGKTFLFGRLDGTFYLGLHVRAATQAVEYRNRGNVYVARARAEIAREYWRDYVEIQSAVDAE